LPRDHWLALLRRDIDPIYIETGGNDGWTNSSTRSDWPPKARCCGRIKSIMQLRAIRPLSSSRTVNRLVDITPARLIMIAAAIRDAGADQTRRDQRLGLMLRQTDQRPRLRLEQSMVQALLWPRKPPKRKKRHDARQRPPETPQAPPVGTPEPELASPPEAGIGT
jgi:hypothetical protein